MSKTKKNTSGFVLDASAVLAAIKKEVGYQEVIKNASGALISSLNLCEVISKLADWDIDVELSSNLITSLGIEILAFDQSQSVTAAGLRKVTAKLGLSLGDRACLALAIQTQRYALTADKNWARIKNIGCEIKLIR